MSNDIRVQQLLDENDDLSKQIFEKHIQINELNAKINKNREELMKICQHQWEPDRSYYEPCGLTPRICSKCSSTR